jgi:hypothetical protein
LPLAGVVILLLGWLLWPSGATATVVHSGPAAVTVDKPRMGTTSVEIDLTESVDVATVTVAPTMPLLGVTVPPVGAVARSAGHFEATGVTLPATGPCELRLVLTDRHGGTSSIVAAFTVSG